MYPNMISGLVLLMKCHEKDLLHDLSDINTVLRDIIVDVKRNGMGPMLDQLIAGFADESLLQAPVLATYTLNVINELLQDDGAMAPIPNRQQEVFIRLFNVWSGGRQVQFLKVLLAKIQDAPNPPVFAKTAALLSLILQSDRRDLAQQAATLLKAQPRLMKHQSFTGVKAIVERL
jgi:hypothetical protein